MANEFPIINIAAARAGRYQFDMKEPTVGKWYCGFDRGTSGDKIDEVQGTTVDRDGIIAKYEGNGQFYDEEGAEEPIDMTEYDYLVEQG